MVFQNVIMPFSEYQNIIVSQGNMTHIMVYSEYQNVIAIRAFETHVIAHKEFQNVIIIQIFRSNEIQMEWVIFIKALKNLTEEKVFSGSFRFEYKNGSFNTKYGHLVTKLVK